MEIKNARRIQEGHYFACHDLIAGQHPLLSLFFYQPYIGELSQPVYRLYLRKRSGIQVDHSRAKGVRVVH